MSDLLKAFMGPQDGDVRWEGGVITRVFNGGAWHNVPAPLCFQLASALNEVEWHKKNSDKWQDTQAAHLREVTRLTAENEKLGRDYQSARDAHDKVLAENEKLRAVLDILQAAMTAKKPIPLAFKKAIIEARAELSGDKHE
jgi:hypothetical protein